MEKGKIIALIASGITLVGIGVYIGIKRWLKKIERDCTMDESAFEYCE